MLAFLKPLIAPLAKYALIGVAAYFLYGEVLKFIDNHNTRVGNLAAQEVVLKVNKTTIAALEKNVELLEADLARKNEILEAQTKAIGEANEYKNKIDKILSKRDTEKLLAARPTLMDRYYNRGTANLFRMWERKTGELVSGHGASKTDMPRTPEITTTTTGEDAAGKE